MYLSANMSTLDIAFLEFGNLFCVRYKYKSLKYGLFKYPACISFISDREMGTFQYFSLNDFQDLIYVYLLGQIFLNDIIGIDQIC